MPKELPRREPLDEAERELLEIERLPESRKAAMMLLSLLRIADAVEDIADALDKEGADARD